MPSVRLPTSARIIGGCVDCSDAAGGATCARSSTIIAGPSSGLSGAAPGGRLPAATRARVTMPGSPPFASAAASAPASSPATTLQAISARLPNGCGIALCCTMLQARARSPAIISALATVAPTQGSP